MKESNNNFLGLLALGICIILSVNKFTDTKRVVNVKGLATQEVLADHVIWPLVIQDVDNDLIKLYSSMDKKSQEIVRFLKDGGIKDDVQHSRLEKRTGSRASAEKCSENLLWIVGAGYGTSATAPIPPNSRSNVPRICSRFICRTRGCW